MGMFWDSTGVLSPLLRFEGYVFVKTLPNLIANNNANSYAVAA